MFALRVMVIRQLTELGPIDFAVRYHGIAKTFPLIIL